MPKPVKAQGYSRLGVPCTDLPGWSNTELPEPRSPIGNQAAMEQVRDRLRKSDR